MLRAPSPLTRVGAADRFGLARRIGHLRGDAVGVLRERREGGGEAKLDIGVRLGELERLLDDLDALALQHVGKAGVVLEQAVVELGDPLALGAVPVVEQRRDDAARLELLVEADAVEQLERRRMIGAGARHLLEEIVVAQRLDQTDLDAVLRQLERQAQPDRPGPDDDDAV